MNPSVYQGSFWRLKRFQPPRRIPAGESVTLEQKRIFILPAREGWYFILVVLLMLLAGINYQNSLILAVAFLLLSVFIVGILHTYRNLSGLTLRAGGASPAFAGEDAGFKVLISRTPDREHEALHLGWDPLLLKELDVTGVDGTSVSLFVPTRRRGLLNPGRLLIQTYFPLGLCRAWSWVDLDMSTLVYPKPVAAGDVPLSVRPSEEGELVEREGADDFYGLRDYQQGDPLHHVDWKSYARSDHLMIKQFAAYVERSVWLDWNYFNGMDTESRLSRLCYWVIRYSASSDEYGLRLPGLEIQPSRGDHHRQKLLRALALFREDNVGKGNGR